MDRDVRWLSRAGGISALILGAGYIVIIPLYAHVGVPPHGGEPVLKYLVGKSATWWVILGLSVFTDLLFVPVGLSLYSALKDVNRSVMLFASAFVGLFIALDLAVTWTNFASLISLSGDYASAASDAQRQAYVAAANYATAILDSRLEAVYSIGTLSFAILLIGFVMLKSRFNVITAYLGLATGVTGIFAVTGVGVAVILNAVFATAWVLFTGYRLYRLEPQP